MADMIEYGWVEQDEGGAPFVAKTERRARMRVRPVEAAPAETRAYEAEWREGGRSGRIVGKLFVEALVLPAEIKTGADGRPTVRPIQTAAKPAAQPWQEIVGPLYDIGPETITRYWEARDRSLDAIKAERVAAIKAEMTARINDRLLEADDASDIRAAGRTALAAVAAAETARAAAEVAVDWPA